MQRSPDDCRLCRKSTSTSLSDLKKRLSLLSAGAEHVRQIIKSFIETSCFIAHFTFEEPEFCASDYMCSSCISLLTNYEKAKKRLEVLQGEMKTCLQDIMPATLPPPWESESSPIVSPLGRRRTRPPVLTSTPKRLRLEAREQSSFPSSIESEEARVKVCICSYLHACMQLHFKQ